MERKARAKEKEEEKERDRPPLSAPFTPEHQFNDFSNAPDGHSNQKLPAHIETECRRRFKFFSPERILRAGSMSSGNWNMG
jgi:hypothetical protein